MGQQLLLQVRCMYTTHLTIITGFKHTSLRVRVGQEAQEFVNGRRRSFSTASLSDSRGMPAPPIMQHLLDLYFTHFGCQFPFLTRKDVDSMIENGTESPFLFNSIASVAARLVASMYTVLMEDSRLIPISLFHTYSHTNLGRYSTIVQKSCLDLC